MPCWTARAGRRSARCGSTRIFDKRDRLPHSPGRAPIASTGQTVFRETYMHNIAPMTDDQRSIQEAVAAVCAQFTPEYWRKCDETGNWPEEFTKAMADGGWLGI